MASNASRKRFGSEATFSDSRILPYRPDQLFDLVADVERYPEFLPMWEQATIFDRRSNGYSTDQVVRLGLLRTRFRSETVLRRPQRIEITSSEGIFRHFAIQWQFAPGPDGRGCQVACHLACEARSPLLQTVLGFVLVEAGRSIIRAFDERARVLYGEQRDVLASTD